MLLLRQINTLFEGRMASMCLGLHYATRELRDRWVNKLGKGERESDLVSGVDVRMEDKLDKVGDWIAMEGDVRDCRLPRYMILVEDGNHGMAPAHWMPCVHVDV